MHAATFNLGQVVATPVALDALQDAGVTALAYLQRHSGDWGEVDAEDWQKNEFSLNHSLRLLSAYTLPTGVKIWLITEADRSSTCVLLPEEY